MRRRLIRASSFVFLTAVAVGAGPSLMALGACSSFDADPDPAAADGGGGELEAGPSEAAADGAIAEAATDASAGDGDGDAACTDLIGNDFLKGNWTLGGNATHMGNFDVALTGAGASQGGIAWHAFELAPGQSFRASFTLRVTTTDVAPADGVAFFWSDDTPPLLGSLGNLLGFCGGVNGGALALVTSVYVDAGVPSSNVSVKHNQTGACGDDGPVATTTALASATAGTVSATIEFLLDGPTAKVTVRRDGTTVIDQQQLGYVPDHIKAIGFTAATGNNYASHEITDFKLSLCP